MKETRFTLQNKGWTGWHRNSVTGNCVKADYYLDDIAWTMNNAPDRIVYENKDLSGEVAVYIKNDSWVPYEWTSRFALRPMSKQELLDADKRLSEIGVSVNRKN